MVCRLKNRKLEREGQIFRNAISAEEFFVPKGRNVTDTLSDACNVPRQFIQIVSSVPENTFIVLVPQFDYMDAVVDPSCSICGDSVYGRACLDRDIEAELLKSCYRCQPEYICFPCRVQERASRFICLACVETDEEYLVTDTRRLRAMQAFRQHMDDIA